MKNYENSADKHSLLLYKAIEENDIKTIKRLVNKGININMVNEFGETPLHSAASCGRTDIAKYFIELGANVNAKDMDGFTPLHDTVFLGYTNTAKCLIENGANVDVKKQ